LQNLVDSDASHPSARSGLESERCQPAPDLEQSTLSEHEENGILRVVNQSFKVVLNIGTLEEALRNSYSGRPDFGIGTTAE